MSSAIIANDNWKRTTAAPSLNDGEIDLWCFDLDRDPVLVGPLFELLSDDERMRADKYVFAKDRTQFIVCRATLRKILGGYLAVSPHQIRFSAGHFGKPSLSEHNDVRFNVSHSHGLAVIAVAQSREVGVDIEYISLDFDVMSVAPRLFSAAECSEMRSLSPAARAIKFFEGWTRKEALLKAIGDGLSSSDEIQSVASLIGKDIVYRSVDGDKVTDWSVTSFEIQEDFKASLAVEKEIGTIRLWQYSDESSR